MRARKHTSRNESLPRGRSAAVRRIAAAGALTLAGTLLWAGCSSPRPAVPRMPDEIPTRLPSEIEAGLGLAERAEPARPETTAARPSGAAPSSRPEAAAPAPRAEDPAAAATEAPQETAPAYEISGYRVQVFATARESVARRFAERMRAEYAGEGQRVYVFKDGSLYKVRIGDCRTREDALRLRERVLAHGQNDAFVIRTRIQPNRPPESPTRPAEGAR